MQSLRDEELESCAIIISAVFHELNEELSMEGLRLDSG